MTIDFSKLSDEQLAIAAKIVDEAKRQGVDPNFALAIAGAESRYRHSDDKGVITSPKGAVGIMQIMPSTAQLYRKRDNIEIDPNDVDSNIYGGVYILKDLLNSYKTPLNAAIAYNAGPGYLKNLDTQAGNYSGLPKETLKYIEYINQFYPFDQSTGFPVKQENEGDRIVREMARQDGTGGANPNGAPTPLPDLADPTKYALYGTAAGLFAGNVAEGLKSNWIEVADAKFDAAKKELKNAQINLTELEKKATRLGSSANLEVELNRARNVYNQAEANLDVVEKELKALNKSQASRRASVVNNPAAAAGRTIPGASGASNWVRKMGDDVPEVLARTAENMRADNPSGGQNILDLDAKARETIRGMGAGNYPLSGTGSSQLMLPPGIAAERASKLDAELAARLAKDAAARAALAQQEVLERNRVEGKVRDAAEARRNAGWNIDEATRAFRSAQKAEEDVRKGASNVITKKELMELDPKPGIFSRAGDFTAKASPKIFGILSGAATGYTATEAWNEWNKAIDTFKKTGTMPPISDAVVRTLEAFFGGLSMVPPRPGPFLIARGVGTLGGLGMLGYEVLKNADPRDARKGALAARRAPLDMPTPAPLSPREAENLVASGDPRLINIYQNDPQVARLLRLSQVTQ